MSKAPVSIDGIEQEAQRRLDYLASVKPELAVTTVTRAVAARVLLLTDGVMLLQGRIWEIVCKSLGAGVYRLTLKMRGDKPCAPTFVVPCAACGHDPRHWKHGLPVADSVVRSTMSHDYMPDESSVEWAALKLRKALEAATAHVETPQHERGPIWHHDGHDIYRQSKQALELADAAGIRQSEPSS